MPLFNVPVSLSSDDFLEQVSMEDFIEFVKDGDEHYQAWDTVFELCLYFFERWEEYASESMRFGESCSSPGFRERYFLEDQLYDSYLVESSSGVVPG